MHGTRFNHSVPLATVNMELPVWYRSTTLFLVPWYPYGRSEGCVKLTVWDSSQFYVFGGYLQLVFLWNMCFHTLTVNIVAGSVADPGSGIRCLFDPWDPRWLKIKIRIRYPHPGWTSRIISPRAQLRNNPWSGIFLIRVEHPGSATLVAGIASYMFVLTKVPYIRFQ